MNTWEELKECAEKIARGIEAEILSQKTPSTCEKKRWFFDIDSHDVCEWDGIALTQLPINGFEKEVFEHITINDCFTPRDIEVTEQDLPYLEQPDGDWVFKKVEIGDDIMTCWRTKDKTHYAHGGVSSNVKDFELPVVSGILRGYRWVKSNPDKRTESTPKDAELNTESCTKHNLVDAKRQTVEQDVGRFVESSSDVVTIEAESSSDGLTFNYCPYCGEKLD